MIILFDSIAQLKNFCVIVGLDFDKMEKDNLISSDTYFSSEKGDIVIKYFISSNKIKISYSIIEKNFKQEEKN